MVGGEKRSQRIARHGGGPVGDVAVDLDARERGGVDGVGAVDDRRLILILNRSRRRDPDLDLDGLNLLRACLLVRRGLKRDQ